MVEIKDKDVKRWIKSFKTRVIRKYKPSRMILFGSRARGEHLLESDVDLVIVSEKFKGIKWPRRIGQVAQLWHGLVTIEPLCYTPFEFSKKVKEHGIVRQAVKEGIKL